ncbi:hypothetical protein [Anabaena lutea]|nr:hypothetical protein [Anabaena lutea]
MEELLELRQLLEQGKTPEALLLVDELEQGKSISIRLDIRDERNLM